MSAEQQHSSIQSGRVPNPHSVQRGPKSQPLRHGHDSSLLNVRLVRGFEAVEKRGPRCLVVSSGDAQSNPQPPHAAGFL